MEKRRHQKQNATDKDLIKSADALSLDESDWNKKYPGLVFTKTDYNYYNKLGKCYYNLESDDEPNSLGRFH